MTNDAGDGPVSSPEEPDQSPAIQHQDGATGDHQFQALIQAVEEYAIFRLDPDGHVVSWNPGAKAIKGYTQAEILGEHFSTFYTEDDRAAGIPERNLAAATEQGSTEDEGWRVRADGSRFWAHVTITAIRDDDGDLQGYAKVTRDMTERREHEQQLREQAARLERQRDQIEEELTDVFDRVDEAFFTLDDEWRITYVTDRAAELVQLSPGKLLQARVWDVLPEVADGLPRELAEEAKATQEPTGFEFYSDILDIWVEVRAYPSETGMSVYVHDITERKARERELKRYERIVETVQDGVYTVAPDGRFTMVNEAYAAMTGYPREELLGAHVSMVVDEETIETARDHEGELVAGEREMAKIEADLLTADDGAIRAEATFALLPGEGDDYERVGVVRDITERKARERELESRAHQQSAVSDLGQYALEDPDLDELFDEAARRVANVLDNDYCKVLDLDANAEELLLRQGVGWNEGTVGEATVSATEADSQASYTLLSEGPVIVTDLDTETRFSGPELLTSHKVKSGISTIIGSLEDPWGILGTHDTERKEFTDEDVNFVQSVANILAEAIDRHHYQDQLEKVIDELEESNERLEQFAYIASHDLQEPLRMVSSYLQLIESRFADDQDEDIQEFIDFAIDGADRMRDMIDDLLAYSRIDTKAEPLEPTDTEVVVENVLQDLTLRIRETDADIDVGSLPTVDADPNQLEQLFQNLISNAIKYRGEKPPRIEISAERDAGEWVFHVADNGIGIDPAQTDRIFEVFNRLHTAEEYPGTGIGLALCRKIIQRHGGNIWVDSTPGKGSTFSFTLPTEQRTDN